MSSWIFFLVEAWRIPKEKQQVRTVYFIPMKSNSWQSLTTSLQPNSDGAEFLSLFPRVLFFGVKFSKNRSDNDYAKNQLHGNDLTDWKIGRSEMENKTVA